MASQYTFNGVSLDDPGGRWTVDREWYLPPGGPGAAALPVEAPGAALVSADPWDGRYAPEVAVVVSFLGGLSPRDDTWWRLAVLTNWDFSYSGLDVSDGLVVDPLWALCPGVDGTCQFSIEGKVRARPYYV